MADRFNAELTIPYCWLVIYGLGHNIWMAANFYRFGTNLSLSSPLYAQAAKNDISVGYEMPPLCPAA